MDEKIIVSVSEITISAILNIGFCYGCTVQYADGEIRNILRQSPLENDPQLLKIITLERKNYIKHMPKKEQSK